MGIFGAILREYFASRIFTILKYFNSKYALCVPTVATYKLRNKVQLHKLRHFCSAFSRRHVLPHLGTKCHCASHMLKLIGKKLFSILRSKI